MNAISGQNDFVILGSYEVIRWNTTMYVENCSKECSRFSTSDTGTRDRKFWENSELGLALEIPLLG
jgi:hypothetical protein